MQLFFFFFFSASKDKWHIFQNVAYPTFCKCFLAEDIKLNQTIPSAALSRACKDIGNIQYTIYNIQ